MYTVATMNAPELVVLALRVLSAWNAGRALGREDAAVLRQHTPADCPGNIE